MRMLTIKGIAGLMLLPLAACQGQLGVADERTVEASASSANTADAAQGSTAAATDDQAPAADGANDCARPTPGPSPLRRLTNDEYRNTMSDLLSGSEDLVLAVTQNFPREPTSLGFRTGAQALTVTPLIADEYLQAAQRLGEAAVSGGVVPCALDEDAHACIEGFIESYGARVYRRPLTADELARHTALYDSALALTGSAADAAAAVVGALFASPHFLFRVELSKGDDVARPNGYEMATRLSYLLWQTMPDDALFAAAKAGELETAAGIKSQVRRMMDSPKALRVYQFFAQWLDVDEADSVSRSVQFYPEYDETLAELLSEENRAFVHHLLTTGGTFSDLLAADYTFANRALAEHYGLATVPDGDTFEPVPTPDRAGVLTQLPMLIHDRPSRTSIVKRGLKLRTDFLCQIVPAPPADVDFTLPALDGALTQRERLAQHRDNPGCSGCHALMDPLGEIFEGFDATGRPRAVDEGGAPVVTGGAVTNTTALDGSYRNPRELAVAMATDPQVLDCFALQAFRFFYGREATAEDICTQQQLHAAFARDNYRLLDLLLGLTGSDHFLYQVRTEEVGR